MHVSKPCAAPRCREPATLRTLASAPEPFMSKHSCYSATGPVLPIAGRPSCSVPTATFRVLYVFFAIHHARRTVLHVRVTEHPTAAWIIQQLREAFSYAAVPRYLIFDNDKKYGTDVLAVIEHMGILSKQITPYCPWQNGVAERWVETVRRDLLDHVIVLNERHLQRLLSEFVACYHDDRTHLGLGKSTPSMRTAISKPNGNAEIVGHPRIGGLHHCYEWRQAA